MNTDDRPTIDDQRPTIDRPETSGPINTFCKNFKRPYLGNALCTHADHTFPCDSVETVDAWYSILDTYIS